MSATPKPPKAMSSRLLTMKFMQRAAASPTSPSFPDPNPAKRQKQSRDSEAEFSVDSLADKQAVQAAIEEEERIREAAIERAAEQAGDTRWHLSFKNEDHNGSSTSQKSLQVIHTGYATIDSLVSHVAGVGPDTTLTDSPILTGRRSFGKFNRTIERLQNPDAEDLSSSGSDDGQNSENESSLESEEDDPTGANAMIRGARLQAAEQAKAERKAKKKAERAESKRLAGLRKNKEVKLNRLSSLSGGSAVMNDLPNRKRSRAMEENDDRPSRKSRKSY